MITKEPKKRRVSLAWLVVAMLAAIFMGSAFAQDEPVVEEPLLDEGLEILPEELQMPGTIEGAGTYFEVTDSEYLNIVLQSSEPVNLRLESVPQMVVMDIEAAEGAASTQVILTGFEPSTTYYKYEEDYHNEVAFTTDGDGSYSFTQDLAIAHLVFIQPGAGTIFLSDTGWSDPTVGIWDPITKTGTLTTDLYETIQIDSDGITLDGNGHTVTGCSTGNGVYLPYRTGVTVKNLNVQDFTLGIYLYYSNGNTVNGNVLTNNNYGIRLSRSMYNSLTGNIASNNFYGIIGGGSNNTLTSNTANSNSSIGINISWSGNNSLTGNTANFNGNYGIYVSWSGNDSLTGNTANSNSIYGIYLYQCYYNTTLTGNTANSNIYIGIYLSSFSYNSLTGNTANSNGYYGILLANAWFNTLTGNTANSNNFGIILGGSSRNSLTGNTINLNAYDGLLLGRSSYCTLTGNTVSQNYRYGLRLVDYSWDNHIYNNNFIDNLTQAYVTSDCLGNVFNLEEPIGGNYWSDWTSPDDDGDGFVDEPYVIDDDPSHLVQDNLPWVVGWNQPPEADAGVDLTVEAEGPQGTEVILDGSASTDPDSTPGTNDDIVSFEWYEGDALLDSGETINYTFALGTHVVTLVVTDSHGEVDEDEVIIIVQDTIPPVITIDAPEMYGLYRVGDLTLAFTASDSGSGLVNLQATLSDAVGYSVPAEPGDIVVAAGVYTLLVEATDTAGNYAESEVFFVVYDPEGGFVTGGGWIDSPEGAYKPDTSLTGKANFGFVSKYKKGATVPTGNTEFVFKAGDLNFHSRNYDWLVVTGSNYVRFKGSGTISDEGDYRFMLWAKDDEPDYGDTFRIRIWQEDDVGNETDVYDNGFNQPIVGGNIVVHTGN